MKGSLIFLNVFWIILSWGCSTGNDTEESIFMKGKKEMDDGDWESAIVYFDSCVLRNPRNDSAIYLRAICYSTMGNIGNAMNDLNALIQKSESLDMPATKERGILYAQSNDYESALTDLNTVIQNIKDDAGAYYSRGIIKKMRMIYGHNPDTTVHSISYTDDGREFYHDSKGALEDLSKAIEIDTNFGQAYFARGSLLNELDFNIHSTTGCADICKAIQLGYRKTGITHCPCN